MLVAEQGIRAPLVPLWRMIRHLYPVYRTIADCLQLAAPPYDTVADMDLDDNDCLFRIAAWIEEVDANTQPHHLRSVLQELGIGSSDLCLQMWLQHFLSKPAKSAGDRDKIDFLLVHYLRLNLPPSLQEGRVSRAAIAAVLEPVLGATSDELPTAMHELNELIGIAERCRSLADIERSGIILRGRELKLRAGDPYFTPPFLLAFTHFNAVVRRECQRLMNSDLKFIGEALERLEKQGITHVDCTAANWSDHEALADLKNKWATWELDNRDYSGDFFASLIGFRAAMDEAVSRCVELSMSFVSQELRNIHSLLHEMHAELDGLPRKLAVIAINVANRAARPVDTTINSEAPKEIEILIPGQVVIPNAVAPGAAHEIAGTSAVVPEVQPETTPEEFPVLPAQEPFTAIDVTPNGILLQPPTQPEIEKTAEAVAPVVSADEKPAPVDPPATPVAAPESAPVVGVPDLNEGITRLQKILCGKRPGAVSIAVAGTRVLLTGAEVAMFSDNENASAKIVQRAVMARIFVVGALEAHGKNRDKAQLAAVAGVARKEQEELRAIVATCKASKLVREEEIVAATGKQLSAMLERAERILR